MSGAEFTFSTGSFKGLRPYSLMLPSDPASNQPFPFSFSATAQAVGKGFLGNVDDERDPSWGFTTPIPVAVGENNRLGQKGVTFTWGLNLRGQKEER